MRSCKKEVILDVFSLHFVAFLGFRFCVFVFLGGWSEDLYFLAGAGGKIFCVCISLLVRIVFVFLISWHFLHVKFLVFLFLWSEGLYFLAGVGGKIARLSFLSTDAHSSQFIPSSLFKSPSGFQKEQHFRMWLKYNAYTCPKLMSHFSLKQNRNFFIK